MARLKNSALAFMALMLATLWSGCAGESFGPSDSSLLHLELHVTGGIAGVDYHIEVDGEERVVRGIACNHLCDFRAGEVILGLSPYQMEALLFEVRRSGLAALGRRNYGGQCCDQFGYELRYDDRSRTALVTGDGGTLPDQLRPLIETLNGMAGAMVPVIAEPGSARSDWPTDPLGTDSVRIDGNVLTLKVMYGGGCKPHDLDMVAYGGFMESSPVRIWAAIAHEDRQDLCEALITRRLRFDLLPLARSHQRAYGGNGATILILLDNPNDPAKPVTIEYRYSL